MRWWCHAEPVSTARTRATPRLKSAARNPLPFNRSRFPPTFASPPAQSSFGMPRACLCGARQRADLSCGTPGCPAFRESRRGVALTKRPTRRLGRKQHLNDAWARRGKGPPKGGQLEEVDPAPPPPAGEAVGPAPGHGSAQAGGPELLLRSSVLESMLVDMFGWPGHFAILAVAFRRGSRTSGERALSSPHLGYLRFLAAVASTPGLSVQRLFCTSPVLFVLGSCPWRQVAF